MRNLLIGLLSAALLTVPACENERIADNQSILPEENIQEEETVTGEISASSDNSYFPVFSENENTEKVEFLKKTDGDTAHFLSSDGEDMTVRFLAIDTPETVKRGTEVQEWGPEASEYTADRLENADIIYLEWDNGSDKQDKYGRYLAWIWVDGSLLEAELVEQGYAKVAYIYGDYKYTDDLYAIQDQAQENHVGIWSD